MFSIDLRNADSGSTGLELMQLKTINVRKRDDDLVERSTRDDHMHTNNRDDKDYRMSTEETKEENDRSEEHVALSNRLAPRFADRTSGKESHEEVKVMNDYELGSNESEEDRDMPGASALEFADRQIIDVDHGGVVGVVSSLDESNIQIDSHESDAPQQ